MTDSDLDSYAQSRQAWPQVIVSWTGHRDPARMPADSEALIDRSVRFLKETHCTGSIDRLAVMSGMAFGVDMMVAQSALKLGVRLIAAVPWAGFAGNWPDEARREYLDILDRAWLVRVISDTQIYRPWVYEKRDQWMVDNSTWLCSVWDGVRAGGTWNTVKYARKRGRERSIIYLHKSDR